MSNDEIKSYIEQGKLIPMDCVEYRARGRQRIQMIASSYIDNGQDGKAMIALAEIARLDHDCRPSPS